MDRRGFLGRLLAGLAVTATAPALDLFTAPAEGAPAVPVPTYEDAFLQLVKDATDMFIAALPWPSYHLVTDSIIGQGPLTHQYTIALSTLADAPDRETFIERYVRPAMMSLAERASHVSAFGVLSMPRGGNLKAAQVTNVDSGVSVRGVQAYDMWMDADILRFDVVCG